MSCRDDYNKAVFLNAYGNGKPLRKNEEYQRYFEFECGITNPRSYHKHLIKEGYLEPSSTTDIISSLKVSELKIICDSLGISKNGKKQDLVEKIISSSPPNFLCSFTKEELYSLSAKGISFMKEHEDYVTLHNHKNWDISLEEYVDFKHSFPFYGNFRDIVWGIFNKRVIEYSNKYGFLRNNYLNMSYLMKEENNHKEELRYLLYVLFFDVCGVENVEHLEFYDSKEEVYERLSYDCMAFDTRIPSYIASLKDYYEEAYIDKMYSQYNRLPLNLCDVTTFKLMISDIFNGCEKLKEKYESIFSLNFHNYIDNYFSSQTQYKHSNISPKNGGCLSSVITVCLIIFILSIVV